MMMMMMMMIIIIIIIISSDSIVGRAGGFGDLLPVGSRFSAHVQTDHETHPVSKTMCIESFPGVKVAEAWR